MITDELKKKSYELLKQFIEAVNSRDQSILKERFNINNEIFCEIIENLEEYFGENFSIEPPPYEGAFEKNARNEPDISLFEMNEPGNFGIECAIWMNKKYQEPILHAEISKNTGDWEFIYKYIGS